MIEPITFREAADLIAAAEQRVDSERVYQQLRGAANRKLLQTSDQRGPKGAHRFSIDQVVVGRILMVALDLGIEADALHDLAVQLQHGRTYLTPNGLNQTLNAKALLHAFEDANAVEWFIEIIRFRDSSASSTVADIGWITSQSRLDRPDPWKDELVDARVEAVIKIPVTRLARPLVHAFRRG